MNSFYIIKSLLDVFMLNNLKHLLWESLVNSVDWSNAFIFKDIKYIDYK